MCVCVSVFSVTPANSLWICFHNAILNLFCFTEVYYEVSGKWLRFLHKISFSLFRSLSSYPFNARLNTYIVFVLRSATCCLHSCTHGSFVLHQFQRVVFNFSFLPLLSVEVMCEHRAADTTLETFNPCTTSHSVVEINSNLDAFHSKCVVVVWSISYSIQQGNTKTWVSRINISSFRMPPCGQNTTFNSKIKSTHTPTHLHGTIKSNDWPIL